MWNTAPGKTQLAEKLEDSIRLTDLDTGEAVELPDDDLSIEEVVGWVGTPGAGTESG